MRIGKLNWDDLNYILEKKSVKRPEVITGSGIGEDCAIVNFGEEKCVLSTDPITGAAANIGKLAVNINCNDIASAGVEPLGIMVTILAPPNTTLDEIKVMMSEIDEECRKLNVEIIGGHTEVTDAVNKLIVSCTVVGKGKRAVSTKGAEVGDSIIVTKYIGLEGTSILCNDRLDSLKDVLTKEELEEGKSMVNYISVVEEGKIAGAFGVTSMHDATEGGILGALWEMAEASEVGFKIYEDKVPISNVTKKVCEHFKIDPMRLISSGSMVMTCKDGEELINRLNGKNINAEIIGCITEKNGILKLKDGKEINVEPPECDELFKIEG